MTERIGEWIETYTGQRIWPLDVRPEDVNVCDVARALSMLCRYGGHVRFFYSVAAHCCVLADHVLSRQWAEPGDAFEILCHDASEAYLADVPRPLKRSLPEYRIHEGRAEASIARAWDLRYPSPNWLKDFDTRVLADERAVLMSLAMRNTWGEPQGRVSEPLGVTIPRWTPDQAEAEWLERWYTLNKRRNNEQS